MLFEAPFSSFTKNFFGFGAKGLEGVSMARVIIYGKLVACAYAPVSTGSSSLNLLEVRSNPVFKRHHTRWCVVFRLIGNWLLVVAYHEMVCAP